MSASSSSVEKRPPKRLALSLKLQKAQTQGHFCKVSDDEVSHVCEGVVPTNTKLSNEWVLRNLKVWILRNFKVWMTIHNKVPADLLSNSDAATVCKWLCRFI